MINFIITVGGSIFGGIIASLIAIKIWEWQKQPKLLFEIPKKVTGKEPSVQKLCKKCGSLIPEDIDTCPLCKSSEKISRAFYHLKVRNVGKSPAYSCRIIIKFFDSEAKKLLFSVNGKWDKGPQPLIYTPIPIEITPKGVKTITVETKQDFLIPFTETLDIHPDMPPESFCIIVKYDGEEECYAFSSWSYILGKGHKVDDWKLIIGKYMMEIDLSYSGKRSIKKNFLLVNRGPKINDV